MMVERLARARLELLHIVFEEAAMQICGSKPDASLASPIRLSPKAAGDFEAHFVGEEYFKAHPLAANEGVRVNCQILDEDLNLSSPKALLATGGSRWGTLAKASNVLTGHLTSKCSGRMEFFVSAVGPGLRTVERQSLAQVALKQRDGHQVDVRRVSLGNNVGLSDALRSYHLISAV